VKEVRFNAPKPSFYDEYLSNFSRSDLVYEGVSYPTVEHAYQAQKTLSQIERIRIAGLETPGKAKKAGRDVDLREDWEDVKFQVMVDLLRLKFRIPLYREALMSTEDSEIIEDASGWNDTVWGVGRAGSGQNLLGKALMKIREEIREGEE